MGIALVHQALYPVSDCGYGRGYGFVLYLGEATDPQEHQNHLIHTYHTSDRRSYVEYLSYPRFTGLIDEIVQRFE